jgi:hypothetical protein
MLNMDLIQLDKDFLLRIHRHKYYLYQHHNIFHQKQVLLVQLLAEPLAEPLAVVLLAEPLAAALSGVPLAALLAIDFDKQMY